MKTYWRYRFPDEENGGKVVGYVAAPADWDEKKARKATARAVGLPRGVSLKKMRGPIAKAREFTS